MMMPSAPLSCLVVGEKNTVKMEAAEEEERKN